MSSPMDVQCRQRLVYGAMLASCVLAAGIWWNGRNHAPSSDPTGEQKQPPFPTVSLSPYLNTTSAADYVGGNACIDCHSEQHAAFAATPHHHALARIDPAAEPPDAEFVHEKSGRAYRVYRKNGQLRHQESLSDGQGDKLVLGDYPLAYRIGSGHHSRSYLVEIDGYLLESPITWYAATGRWALSPGYDHPVHEGFTRAADEGCVHCHAGRVESVDDSTHRLLFREQHIGCESCHGPGSLHVERRSRQTNAEEGQDFTIVHPGRLSRKLSEAICARCHLASAALAGVRGRHRNEFRPGLPLTDFRVDYATEQASDSMKVVGHFEQLQHSRCYVESETLTCTTCHNPHFTPSAAAKTDYYRQKCLSCHAMEKGCKLPEPKRLAQNAENDCVSCHMPKSGTDIPHFAFTHHRIGLKRATTDEQPNAPALLMPIGDVSRLSSLDQDRCLGLAYLHFGDKLTGPARVVPLRNAMALLELVHTAGIRDARVLGGLAYLHWERGSAQCAALAEEALKSPDCEPETRVNSLIVLGDARWQLGDVPRAKAAFKELTTLRLRSVDWQMLALCRARERKYPEAIAALRKAVALKPDQADLRALLQEWHVRANDPAAADLERAALEILTKPCP